MNREIKFRGYSKELEKWYYGSYYNGFGWGDFIIRNNGFEQRQQVSHDSVMQYTGLKDKNGTEIYEGDFLRQAENTSYRFGEYGLVEYESDYAGFIVKGRYSKNQYHETLDCDIAVESEIIGNLFSHPQLLTP